MIITRVFSPASVATILVAALSLGACATTGGDGSAAGGAPKSSSTASYRPVADIPIPTGTKINTEKSFILGMSENWVGKVVLDVDRPSTQAVSYYKDQMPTFGWEEVTEVQGKTSIISYIRNDRAATVAISAGVVSGSDVTITVSPRTVATIASKDKK